MSPFTILVYVYEFPGLAHPYYWQCTVSGITLGCYHIHYGNSWTGLETASSWSPVATN